MLTLPYLLLSRSKDKGNHGVVLSSNGLESDWNLTLAVSLDWLCMKHKSSFAAGLGMDIQRTDGIVPTDNHIEDTRPICTVRHVCFGKSKCNEMEAVGGKV
jgi:hypothetical protein